MAVACGCYMAARLVLWACMHGVRVVPSAQVPCAAQLRARRSLVPKAYAGCCPMLSLISLRMSRALPAALPLREPPYHTVQARFYAERVRAVDQGADISGFAGALIPNFVDTTMSVSFWAAMTALEPRSPAVPPGRRSRMMERRPPCFAITDPAVCSCCHQCTTRCCCRWRAGRGCSCRGPRAWTAAASSSSLRMAPRCDGALRGHPHCCQMLTCSLSILPRLPCDSLGHDSGHPSEAQCYNARC